MEKIIASDKPSYAMDNRNRLDKSVRLSKRNGPFKGVYHVPDHIKYIDDKTFFR